MFLPSFIAQLHEGDDAAAPGSGPHAVLELVEKSASRYSSTLAKLLGTTATVEYYRDPDPDRPTQEELDQVEKY